MKKAFLLAATLVVGLTTAKSQVTTIDNGDSKSGWTVGGSAITLDTKDFKEGTASLSSDGEGPFRFRKVFNNPIDIGDGKSGYISMWYYIDNIDETNANRGFVVLSSSGKLEEDALRFPFKDAKLQKGWNYLIFNLEDAIKAGNFSGKISYFALFQRGSVPNSLFKLDDIRYAKKYEDVKAK